MSEGWRRRNSPEGQEHDDLGGYPIIPVFHDGPTTELAIWVRPISQEGLGLLGIDPTTNKLFWDGNEIVLRDRIRLSSWQRFLATIAACGMFGTFLVQASQAGWWMYLWQRIATAMGWS